MSHHVVAMIEFKTGSLDKQAIPITNWPVKTPARSLSLNIECFTTVYEMFDKNRIETVFVVHCLVIGLSEVGHRPRRPSLASLVQNKNAIKSTVSVNLLFLGYFHKSLTVPGMVMVIVVDGITTVVS